VKKKLVIAGSILLALVALAGALAWYYMGKPLYEPGQVASGKDLRASLTPPAQSKDDTGWVVEPGITLHHHAHGTGRKVLVVHGGPGKPIQRPWPGLEALSGEYTFLYYDQRGCGCLRPMIALFNLRNMVETSASAADS
jgi:hypothetical protein